jgi:RimJ/RimL family protein N-acetyltransferase
MTSPDSQGLHPPVPPDTAAIEIRPVRPEDRPALQAGFDRLSERSRYRRFLSPHPRLTDAELRYFTEVDHHDHEALVAIDTTSGHGVGIARFIRSPVDHRVAELAVAVVDDWQGRGIGTRLAFALADRAREEGITAFTALVLTDNSLMLSIIRELGAVHDVHTEEGITELTVDLPEHGLGPVSNLLRAAARGEIDAGTQQRPPVSLRA